jgi:hypothetical protein
MNRKILLVLTVLSTISTAGHAQSMLSLTYPFGLPLRPLSGGALSMGGTSAGITDDHNVMLTNPGNLGTIDITAFSTLWTIDYLRINDRDDYTDHLRAVPGQISFALPLGIGGTIAFSMSKTSDAGFKYRQDRILTLAGDMTHPEYTRVSFDREGGSTSWQAGWGRRFGKHVSAGLVYERLFFTEMGTKLTEITYQYLDMADTTYKTSDVRLERDSTHLLLKGNGLHLGILGMYKKLNAGIAFSYYFASDLQYHNAIYNGLSGKPIDSAATVLKSGEFDLQLPYSITGGISYAFSPRWLAGADVAVQLWQFYETGSASVLPEISSENTVSLSAGFRFIPAPDLLAPRYGETIHYRAGARYTQLPGGTSSEVAGACGIGLPLMGNGLLDLGIEVGRRTHEQFSDYNELFLKCSIGLNGGRAWNKTPSSTY